MELKGLTGTSFARNGTCGALRAKNWDTLQRVPNQAVKDNKGRVRSLVKTTPSATQVIQKQTQRNATKC